MESPNGDNPSIREPSLEEGDGHVVVPVELTVLGARVRGQARVPTTRTRTSDMLPAFRVVADTVTKLVEWSIKQHGGEMSCRKGCAACCRQAVAVAHSEAYRMREVVESLPEPRRSEVKARFVEAERRVTDAGLFERFMFPERFSKEELAPAPMEYFRLGIACPLLEDEACSIYDERPLVCREYLVTSPAEYCSEPDERVAAVRVPLKSSEALARLDGTAGVRFVKRVPLSLALRFADENQEAEATRTGPESLGAFLENLEATRTTEKGE